MPTPLSLLLMAALLEGTLGVAMLLRVSRQRGLQQYAWLALASETLEPDSVLPLPERTASVLTAPAPRVASVPRAASVPPRLSAVARHVTFVKRSKLGARAWSAARDAVAHARG